MAGTTVRVKRETHAALVELSHRARQPMQEVLAEAVEAYRRERFLMELNASFAALRENPEAYEEELEERRAWDATLSDGLEDDPVEEQQ